MQVGLADTGIAAGHAEILRNVGPVEGDNVLGAIRAKQPLLVAARVAAVDDGVLVAGVEVDALAGILRGVQVVVGGVVHPLLEWRPARLQLQGRGSRAWLTRRVCAQREALAEGREGQ